MRRPLRLLLPFLVTAIATATVAIPASAEEQVEWAQAGFDATHSAHNPIETILDPSTVSGLTLKWAADLAGAAVSSPIVADGLVFETSNLNGTVRAFDAATGGQRWEFRMGQDARINTPAVAGGHVFLSTWKTGVLAALDETTGVLDWSISLSVGVPAPPAAVVDGDRTTVYLGAGATVYAVDGDDGSILWTQTPLPNFSVQATPAVSGGVVYVIDLQPVVHAYDAASGAELWASQTLARLSAVPTYPVVDGARVFVALSSHRLYALDASTGLVEWSDQVKDASQPSAADGVVFVAGRQDARGRLLATDQSTGTRRWVTNLGASNDFVFGDGASVANGVVYVLSLAGAILALDEATGTQLWDAPIPRGWGTMPVVVNGMVYVAVANELLAFGL
jgi:outer membrane protein assembly factor BamB